MSDFRALATVTAALQQLLLGTIRADVPGAEVTTDRPDDRGDGTTPPPGVNVYLYQVMPNPALRNADLPTRDAGGQVTRRPQAAVDLHYLLTFYGNDGELEPQRLLGSTLRTLHARPVISRELIQAVVDAATAVPPLHPDLATTDLADQVELVKLTPLPLNLEELSKLWSVFFQVPYALSVAYQASVVLLTEPVTPALTVPVLEPAGLVVTTLRRPRVERVDNAAAPGAPIVADSTVAVLGSQLAGDTTLVRVAGGEVAVSGATGAGLTFALTDLPAGTLRPGRLPLRVVHQLAVGEVTSNVVALELHPRVTGTAVAAGSLDVTADLPVGARQVAALALLDTATEAVERVLATPERDADGATVTFDTTGVPAGSYLAQLHVDGVPSVIERDGSGNPTGPAVTLP